MNNLHAIPNSQERIALLRSLVPISIASDEEIAETSAEMQGWNLDAIKRRVRSIYISILTFEGEQDAKTYLPPSLSAEDHVAGLFQFNAQNFGVCPQCGYLGSYYCIADGHWLACELHQVKWNVSHFDKGGSFLSWQRHAAIAQALRPVEYPDLSQYAEVVQPLPEPWLEELAQVGIELRAIHHNQKLLEWLKAQPHDFNKGELQDQSGNDRHLTQHDPDRRPRRL